MAKDDGLTPIDHTLRKAAAALRDAELPFMLGGGLACWARGAPRCENDVDLMVDPQDATRVRDVLVEAGMREIAQPEDWLLKVLDGEVAVDVIFSPLGVPISREVIEQAETLPVLAMSMKVMDAEDVLVSRLLALDERHLDFTRHVPVARAVREQIDWERLARRVAESAAAKAFLVLMAEVGVAPRTIAAVPDEPQHAQAHEHVRVHSLHGVDSAVTD